MDSYLLPDTAAPCTDCLITFMQANLEYPDGSYANADTGMWLHHALLYNLNEPDAVCPTTPNRIFATGNERTAADISNNGTKEAGLDLPANVSLLLSPELMNELPTARDVVLTITYEYIPTKPSHFRTVVPVWLDITGVCGSSDFPVPANAAAFDVTAPAWRSNVTGEIVFTAGHVHDGGTVLSILKRNDSVCDSNATYGATPGYVENMSSMNMGMMNSKWGMDMVHISNMSACTDVGRMREGQNWNVKASYDFTQHAPMLDMDGSPSPVMGIALLYMAEERGDGSNSHY